MKAYANGSNGRYQTSAGTYFRIGSGSFMEPLPLFFLSLQHQRRSRTADAARLPHGTDSPGLVASMREFVNNGSTGRSACTSGCVHRSCTAATPEIGKALKS